MQPTSTKQFIQTWLCIFAILSVLAFLQTIQRTTELQIILLRSKWVGLLGIFALTAGMGVWLAFSSSLERVVNLLNNFEKQPISGSRFISGIVLIVSGFAFVWLVRLYVFGNTLPQIMPILWVFMLASLLQIVGLNLIYKSLQWHIAFLIVFLVQGMIYQTYGIFSITSADPFSMGYSEAGRHYYASLFFSESLYGMKLPLPFLHPSRYLLLSIPFLMDGLPLWSHRLWQAFLWFGLTLTASFLIVNRFKLGKWMTLLITVWMYLYFLQGAVYYHLQICTILIFIGVSVKHFWRSLIFIVLASLWAGISRVNWFPVPAMLAITIYILETPINHKGWKYWSIPFTWGVSGLAFAVIAQFIYIQLSGNADVSSFGASFTSDLLWNRLLPNETFAMGILPGIVLVSLPLWFGMYQMIRGKLNHLHPFRWLALLGMLLVLFVGGAIVSAKIGGGGDLHNMDAYLVMLALLTMFFWANQVSPENEAKLQWGKPSWNVIAFALLIPLGFAIRNIGFYPSFDKGSAEKDIQLLQEALQSGGEILFITERQLITFDYLNGMTLVPEYEQSELMEMAMSQNRLYLEKYYADLYNRRFALIVAEDQKFTQQKEGAFVEENVAWVRFIGAPLLCNYKPILTLTSNNVQIFEPRPKHVECKDPFAE